MALKGTLAELGIIELIQFPQPGRKSGELLVAADGREAKLYYEDGRLVHAEAGKEIGEDALVSIVDWTEGTFEFHTPAEAPQTSIEGELHVTLMKALKKRDELKKLENEREDSETAVEGDGSEEAIREVLQNFVSSSDQVKHVCVVSGEGSTVAEAFGPDGPMEAIERLSAALHAFENSYAGATMKRILVEDEDYTAIMLALKRGDHLLVIAPKDAPLGAVSISVNKLAARLG
jgi:predicted regulator of Ras-like GTPase activity (Roadblock/LC7/MglB family)